MTARRLVVLFVAIGLMLIGVSAYRLATRDGPALPERHIACQLETFRPEAAGIAPPATAFLILPGGADRPAELRMAGRSGDLAAQPAADDGVTWENEAADHPPLRIVLSDGGRAELTWFATHFGGPVLARATASCTLPPALP